MATELKKWTVMLYIAAARDEETERAALADLRELERVGCISRRSTSSSNSIAMAASAAALPRVPTVA